MTIYLLKNDSAIMRSRRSVKDGSISSESDTSGVKGPAKPHYDDKFAAPCRAIHKDITKTPMDETDRDDLINGLEAFYEAVQYILNDINAEQEKDQNEIMINIIQLKDGWMSYKHDLLSALKSPYRTNYIDYCHRELFKLAVQILNLLYHPPVTPLYADLMPKLSESLAREYSSVMDLFKTLFLDLMANEAIKHDLIDKARMPLRILRSELPKKYKIFFLVEGKDKPTSRMNDFVKYIDRILKKTQHLATRPDTATNVPREIQQIDYALESLQKFVMDTDEDITVETESQIRGNLLHLFDTTSVTGKSIARFSSVLSEGMSFATGITSFLDGTSTIAGMIRDKARLQAEWFKPPFFSALDELKGTLMEYASMITARYSDSVPIEQMKLSRFVDAYGEKDVLVQQIKSGKSRREMTLNRHTDRCDRLEKLRKVVESIDPANTNSMYLVQQIDSACEHLVIEMRELEAVNHTQKSQGSAAQDEELAIVQKVYDDHEKLLLQMSEDRAEIQRLRKRIEKQQEEIIQKQTEYDELARKMNDRTEKIEKQKERIRKRYGKIEWIRSEVNRLKWENDNMAAREEKERVKVEAKIAKVNDEIEDLRMPESNEPMILKELEHQHQDLIDKVIPNLQYQIERRGNEYQYYALQAVKMREEAELLKRKATALRLKECLAAFEQ